MKTLQYLELSTEKALEIFEQILDKLDDRILIIHSDGRFVYYNQAYLKYYEKVWESVGVSAAEIHEQNLYEKESKDVEVLLPFLKNEKMVKKFLNTPSDIDEHDVFTDIFPLYVAGDHYGIVVIEHDMELIHAMHNELNYYKSLSLQYKQKLTNKAELPKAFYDVIGDSVQMMNVLNMCARVAPTQGSVCLLGESGTGKEVLAEAIHRSSSNMEGPLVKVNCAAIPETLIESELFGYEKGAFTGASPNGRAGKFELANGGTLFLDEIGEMPLAMQAKLLRVIQEREIVRIGGSKTIKLNFRLITATNRDLEKMIEEGTFREDLYYRICVIPIHIPPLRERKEDIPLLANQFLTAYNTNPNNMRSFSDDVMRHFMNYRWPGNIRELKNCVERMSILCPDDCIGEAYLPPQILRTELVLLKHDDRGQYNLRELMEKTEYETIKTVLGLVNGNKTKAMEVLGISRRNFYMKMEKYGLR